MEKPSRTILVFALVLIPLAITAIFKYAPAFTKHQDITSIAILHPRVIGPKEYLHRGDDVAKRLHDALSEVPTTDIQQTGRDLALLASNSGASALIVPTLTIDAGLVQ